MDLGMEKPTTELPVIIIKDGKLIYPELRRYNLTEDWVKEQLKKHNISLISDVILAQADDKNITYICSSSYCSSKN
jgi:uncharacterized membrane protein YcaP (DUF421 family)